MTTWTEELNSTKRNTNTNNYNESENRPPLFICNSFLSLELSVKFLESSPSSERNLMGASTRRCPGGEQVWRYSSVTLWRGVCLTHQRRHKHEREGTPSLNTEVRRCLRSARPPAHLGHAFRGCGSI